jgi:hypothetical protein
MADQFHVIVSWSEDPEENRKNIERAIAEAKRTGRQLLWDTRPYRLNGLDSGASSPSDLSPHSEDSEPQTPARLQKPTG